MKDHLSKNVNPTMSGEWLSHFNSAGNENFSTKYFLSGSVTISITAGDIGASKSFWSSFNIQFVACTKPGVQYLPAFNELSPLVSLRDQVYPPSSFGGSFEIKQFIDYGGTFVLDLLQRESLATSAPIARGHILKLGSCLLDVFVGGRDAA